MVKPLGNPSFGKWRHGVALTVIQQTYGQRRPVPPRHRQNGFDKWPAAVTVGRIAAQQEKGARHRQRQQFVMGADKLRAANCGAQIPGASQLEKRVPMPPSLLIVTFTRSSKAAR